MSRWVSWSARSCARTNASPCCRRRRGASWAISPNVASASVTDNPWPGSDSQAEPAHSGRTQALLTAIEPIHQRPLAADSRPGIVAGVRLIDDHDVGCFVIGEVPELRAFEAEDAAVVARVID